MEMMVNILKRIWLFVPVGLITTMAVLWPPFLLVCVLGPLCLFVVLFISFISKEMWEEIFTDNT